MNGAETPGKWKEMAEAAMKTMISIRRLEGELPIRCEPVGVLFHGDPGTGKSLATARLALLFRTLGVYSMNASDEFEDGIERANVVIVDELMTKVCGESPDLERMLRMISSVPYRPNYAALELKSKNAHFQLVAVTSNANPAKLNTPYHQQAIRRRFPIEVAIYKDSASIIYKPTQETFPYSFTTLLFLIDSELKRRLVS